MERTAINPSTWSTKLGFDKGELVDGHQRQLFVSGQDAVDDDGNPQQAGASQLIRGQHVLLVPSLTPTARRLRGPYSGPSRSAAARRVHQGFPSRRRRESLRRHRCPCLRGEGSREPGLRWRRGRARPRFRLGPHRTSRESLSRARLLRPALGRCPPPRVPRPMLWCTPHREHWRKSSSSAPFSIVPGPPESATSPRHRRPVPVRGLGDRNSLRESAVSWSAEHRTSSTRACPGGAMHFNVVVILNQRGRSKATGIPVDMRFAQVWTLRDGQGVRMQLYASVEEALEAVGLRE